MIFFINNKKTMDWVINNDNPKIIIYHKERCSLCKRYLMLLEDYDFNYYVLNTSEHKDLFKKYKMSMFLPETRIYKKGELIYIKSGVLYNKQIKELIKIIKDNK